MRFLNDLIAEELARVNATKSAMVSFGDTQCASVGTHVAKSLHTLLSMAGSGGAEQSQTRLKHVAALVGAISSPAKAQLVRRTLAGFLDDVPLLSDAQVCGSAAMAGLTDVAHMLGALHFAETCTTREKLVRYNLFVLRLRSITNSLQFASCIGTTTSKKRFTDHLVQQSASMTEDTHTASSCTPKTHPSVRSIVVLFGETTPTVKTLSRYVPWMRLIIEDFRQMHTDESWNVLLIRYMCVQVASSGGIEALYSAVFPTDASPVLAPWYGTTLVALRNYAWLALMTIRSIQAGPTADVVVALTHDEFVWSMLEMLTLPYDDPSSSMLSEMLALRTKSTYLPPSTHFCGPMAGYAWMLLRATMSAMPLEVADAIASRLLSAHATAPTQTQQMILACGLVQTQASMRIIGSRAETPVAATAPPIVCFPVARLVAFCVDGVHAQSIVEFIMAADMGSRDLERLASTELAFTSTDAIEHTWGVYLGKVVAGDGALAMRQDARRVFRSYMEAIDAVMDAWLRQLHGWTDVFADLADAPPVAKSSKSTITLLDVTQIPRRLDRLVSSTPRRHCGAWLAMVMRRYVQHFMWQDANAMTLIHTPSALQAKTNYEDEAKLRVHFRHVVESVLHAARNTSLWADRCHVALVAWFWGYQAQATDGLHDDWSTIVFARDLSRYDDDGAPRGAWRVSRTDASVVDSIVDCAIDFEHALHQAIGTTGWQPTLPTNACVRSQIQALLNTQWCIGGGDDVDDRVRLRDMDEATLLAIGPLRIAASNRHCGVPLTVVSSEYEHGFKIAIMGAPNESALSPASSFARGWACRTPCTAMVSSHVVPPNICSKMEHAVRTYTEVHGRDVV